MPIPAIFKTLTLKQLLLLTAGFSALMLSGALVAQYGFGLYPCELCLYQRYPYMVVIVVAIAAYLWLSPRGQWFALALCTILFAVDAGIAVYHTGVEQGWFPGPSGCSADTAGGQTLEDLRRAIMNAPLVSCDQAMAYVFGLSLAAWNAVFASAAMLFTALALKHQRY